MESGTADRQSVSRKTEVLRVSKVRKSFGEAPVLKEVSFALYEGEILGVIGPSGGGKTTLLRCVDILETIDRSGRTSGTAFFRSRTVRVFMQRSKSPNSSRVTSPSLRP